MKSKTKKIKLKDRESINLLFKSYSNAMYNICLRMTGNEHDACDILQESFYNAYRNLNQLSSYDFFGPWLRKIVINQCIRYQKRRIHWIEINSIEEPVYEDGHADWLNNLPVKVINQEIRMLPDGCRMVFNLYLLENYSHKEVAKMIGISESTSKSQYARAKELLKTKLKKRLEYEQI